MPSWRRILPVAFALLLVALWTTGPARAQVSGQERGRVKKMLKQVRKQLEKHYYDPSFGGMDLDRGYRDALEEIERAPTLTRALGAIAVFVDRLGDSHTYFVPPASRAEVDYGFQASFMGDTCFVTDVTEGGSAEAAGLRLGDAVLWLGPFKLERAGFSKVEYVLRVLRPLRELAVMVRHPGGETDQFAITPEIEVLPVRLELNESFFRERFRREAKRLAEEMAHVYVELPERDAMLWKMPVFDEDRGAIDELIERARKYGHLVLDLRDNPGGSVKTELHLIGSFFGHEVVVGEVQSRDEVEELVAEPNREGIYEGELVVLVNSRSASAAEIFARTIQLQGRGTVVGDRTAGAVMTSRFKVHKVGHGRYWLYATSVSISDLIMPDGTRLEGRGVVPDEFFVPSGRDIQAGDDPVMARALGLVGIGMDPRRAAAIFEEK